MDKTAAEHCAGLVRRFDRDRYLTTLFAPPGKRAALWAVYAFAGELARARDKREEIAREIRLQWWRDVMASIDAGKPQDAPTARALADAVRELGISRDRLEALIDAEEPEASALTVQLALEALGATDAKSMEAGRLVGLAYATGDRRCLDAARALGRPSRTALPALLLRRGGRVRLPLRLALAALRGRL